MLRGSLLALVVVLAGCSADGWSSSPAPADQLAAQAGTTDADPGVVARDAITVVGDGRVRGTPDVVLATVGVEVTADTVDAALERANEQAAQVIEALREAGVASEDIQTRELSVRDERPPPRPEPGTEPPRGDPQIVAVNVVEARIRDLDRAGEILQAASDAGGEATRIRGIRFELEDDDALLEDARERAFSDARDKAEQYAELAGRELGELVAIQEHTSRGRPPTTPPLAEAADEAVPVEPGTEELSVQVTTVWSLG